MEKKLLASSPPENLNRPPGKRNLDKTLTTFTINKKNNSKVNIAMNFHWHVAHYCFQERSLNIYFFVSSCR